MRNVANDSRFITFCCRDPVAGFIRYTHLWFFTIASAFITWACAQVFWSELRKLGNECGLARYGQGNFGSC